MSKINIYETGWLNMVFEGRNKAYGAYQLRTENPKTTIKALFSALFLLGGAAAIPVVINSLQPKEAIVSCPITEPDEILQFTEVKLQQKEEPKTEETVAPEPLIKEKTVNINMVVANRNNVTEETPTNDQLQNAHIGQVNTDGPTATTTNVAPPVAANPGNGASSNVIENIATLEMQPQYPGGIGAFLSTVGKNFKTPEADEEVKTLKVLVAFVIEKDGTLSNIRVTRDPGYNLGKEATRVLNSIKTKWSPGYKNGQPVRTAYNLPITVNVN
nr:energy transducer TonB [uncultured Flavobacterium sp.]